MNMNKKTTWGIIALVAVLIIAAIIFVVDREDPQLEENGDPEEIEVMEGEDLLWDVEDELFYAYDIIYDMEEDLSEEEAEDLFSQYEDLEGRLWDLEDDYFEGEISDEEFEEGLENLLEDIREFVSELEA